MSGLPQDFLAYSIESKIFLRNDVNLITSLSSKFLVSDQIRHKCIGRYIKKNHIDGVFFVVLNIYRIFFVHLVYLICSLRTQLWRSLCCPRRRCHRWWGIGSLWCWSPSDYVCTSHHGLWTCAWSFFIFMHHSSETISKLILEVWSRPLIPLKHKNVWTCRIEQEDSKALKQKCTWYVHHYFHHNTRCSTA